MKLAQQTEPRIPENKEIIEFPLTPTDNNFIYRPFPLHNGEINALVASADGFGAYSAGDDGRVLYSRLADDKSQLTVKVVFEAKRPILALALSPDEQLLAIAQTSKLVIINLKTAEIVHSLTRVRGRVSALEWDPRGQLLAIGMAGGDVFVWSLKAGVFFAGGRDSFDDLERYIGGESPVVKIAFHPSARAFFVAEEAGVLSLWRLLRTEKEMGLRDDFAVIDQSTDLEKRRTFAKLPSAIGGMWMNAEGSYLYVAAEDGNIYSWKVRGLVAVPPVNFGKEGLLNISGFKLEDRIDALAFSSRSQRIKIARNLLPPQREPATNSTNPTVYLENFWETELMKTNTKLLAAGEGSLLWGAEPNNTIYYMDNIKLNNSNTNNDINNDKIDESR